MRKQKIHMLFSLLLVGLLLISSSGITIDAHFCKDQLKGVNFFGKAKTCYGQEARCSLHSEISAKSCCSNKSISIKSIDKAYDLATMLQMPGQIVALPNRFKIELIKRYPPATTYTSFIKYRPPPLITDIQSQYSTFII